MYQVKGEYPDYQSKSLKNNFYLNADQAFNPYTWHAPIHWEGIVGGNKVKFIQIASNAFCKDSFDWSGFPDKLEETKSYIVEAIDNAMRTMD
jgi:hypothetical protein